MTPANTAAKKVEEYMAEALSRVKGHHIPWSNENAVVIANWHSLHARGPEPPEEQDRVLQRIYVE
jgi:hypothetical protein